MKQHLFKLLLLMLCCMMGSMASAHDFEATYNGKTIYYKITSSTDKTVEVTYRGSNYSSRGYSGDVSIPETVTYNEKTYTVTSIGNYAFSYCFSLTSVTIPNSVTCIGDNTFYNCTDLTSVTIGNSVTSIGNGAFYSCSCLTSVDIPTSVTTIGERAFGYCKGLTSIAVEYGNSVYDSREDCNAIIETSTNTLIVGCKNTTIPNSVKKIGDEAFQGCTGLTSVTIPNSVKKIGDEAFWACTGLISVTIGNSVTSIGSGAFLDCGLISVTIPNSVTSIGSSAFSSCTKLTSVHISDLAAWCGISFSLNTSNPVCYAKHLYLNGEIIKDLVIPESVTSIRMWTFHRCTDLISVTIPNSVTSIERYAFEDCSSLTSVTIPNSVTSIWEDAFEKCSSLTEIHWTPNANTNLSSALRSAKLTSTSRTLYLYKNLDNRDMVNTLVSSLNGQFKKIIVIGDYDLTVTDAGMSTLYLDYPVAVPDDDNLIAVFYVNKIEDHIMWLKKVKDYIPANTGVIVQANPVTITFPGTGDDVTAITDNQLQGVIERTPVSSIDGTVYTLGRGRNSGYLGFFKYTGTNLPANKAFMVRNASSGVNGFNLVLDNEDGTSTAIGRIENGKFVPESNVVYDLQGRRVENPSKGIYIVNGKKQYIK